MNIKTTATIIAAAALALLTAAPAFAQSLTATVSANVSLSASTTRAAKVAAALQTRITTGKNRADQEITRRIGILNDLNVRVQVMAKVSASEKASISGEVSTEVSNLTTLQAKIDADTDIPTLQADIKSITAEYRIFMLVIPQGRIEVAADKIGTVADTFTAFSAKLQTRISTAQAAGRDVTALNTSLSDMNAKIADANIQSSAAVSEVASLMPDNGNTTIAASNTAALKDARTKIQAALADLKTARQDAGSIVKGLEALDASATTTTSVSTQ